MEEWRKGRSEVVARLSVYDSGRHSYLQAARKEQVQRGLKIQEIKNKARQGSDHHRQQLVSIRNITTSSLRNEGRK